MSQQFQSKEQVQKSIDTLTREGLPVPDYYYEALRSFEIAEKINPDEFIYSTMAANNEFMTPEKDQVVRDMVDRLLSDVANATQPCLLLGKVQCGKTDTFLSIMGLCFDRGIDVAIVMTKGVNTLKNQTLTRMAKDFRFFKDQRKYSQERIVTIYDAMTLYRRGGLSLNELNDPKRRFIIVTNKETKALEYLCELFERDPLFRSKRVLFCDDEADFASRAYLQRKVELAATPDGEKVSKKELDLLKLAKQIEELRSKPDYHRYLQITATPYSLFLQPDGSVKLRDGEASSWLPRYTGLVPIHDRYIGGHQYYVLSQNDESMYSCLYEPVEPDCIAVLADRDSFYEESNIFSATMLPLAYALACYMVGTAIRIIQTRDADTKYSSSCLIHCELSKENHVWQNDMVTKMMRSFKTEIVDGGNYNLHVRNLLTDAYNSMQLSNELGNRQGLINEAMPQMYEVEAEIERMLRETDFLINTVNSDNPVSGMLNDKGQLRLERSLNIFIGGNILDRGITIDNMLCFVYGRDPKVFQMDSVLQHARMYGARDKEDMACTRFHTTKEIYDVLAKVNEFDELMYEYLKEHRETVDTNDFMSMVVGYHPIINPTAKNKYTPANTKVLWPSQRLLPVGFQTGTPEEIGDAVRRIDEILDAEMRGADVTDEKPFFKISRETAFEIIGLIASTHRYGAEYENTEYRWDPNEMLTALEYCTFKGDGDLWCLVRKDRDMSRERQKSNRGGSKRWIDAPDTNKTEIGPARELATDRPVLMLLRQNGSVEQGWMGAPFYWPVLMTQSGLQSAMFTINGDVKQRTRKVKKQIKLDSIDLYDPAEVLSVPINKFKIFDISLGIKRFEDWELKRTNAKLFLKPDLYGNPIPVESAELGKYYNLCSLNGGVFPFELRDYKYLHLRGSQDMSGSQILVELDKQCPRVTINTPFTQKDGLFDQYGDISMIENFELCNWYVRFNLGKVLELKLSADDERGLAEYADALETAENTAEL